ncbi:MAG: radical SAM protein, partial [Candidatus Thermoplasmatota archaeon]|nr:radical SAM protein [Candidatus Thermoplasmatota archaeon]
ELWKEHDKAMRTKKSKGSRTLFEIKLELAKRMLEECRFCERRCLVNRAKGELGHCKVGTPKIATEFIHWGEEPELIPSYTIFFASCTFHCVYCQNWDISQYPDAGISIACERLAQLIERRYRLREARNLNLVGGEPTPNLEYILEALGYCNANIPVVWNSNMYMTEESMKILDGIVDIYLTDFKYGNDKCAKRLSEVDNYFEIVSRNHKIANKQCELIIRHLVLPNHIECCTKPILDWVANNLSLENVRVNVMAQYRPEYRAHEYEDINRRLTLREFEEAYDYGKRLGLDLIER